MLKYAALAATATMRSHSSSKIILLDTNFLLIPGQFGVDIFAELDRICQFKYEVCVLDATMEELSDIVADRTASAKDRKAARLGLQLLKVKGVKVASPKRKVFKSADKAILDFVSAAGLSAGKSVIVSTQDKLLRDRLRAKGVQVIVLRQKRYLQLQ